MKQIIKRMTACLLTGALALSMVVMPAMAEQNVITNPADPGFVSLDQYIQPTSVPGVYAITLGVGAKLVTEPIDISIILDSSGSMAGNMLSATEDRWTVAKEGANLAIDTFFDPEINGGYDKTRVTAFEFSNSVGSSSTAIPASSNGAVTYKDAAELKSYISSWMNMGGETNMYDAMDVADQLFTIASNSSNTAGGHNLPDYPGESYGGSGDYAEKVKKYVIFLSDGADTSPYGSAMIEKVTDMKIPAAQGGLGVNFYTIGVGIKNQNSEADGIANPYANWTKHSTANPLQADSRFTGYMQNSGFLTVPTNQVNGWIYDWIDLVAESGMDPTITGFEPRTNLFNGYFDIPGDSYPTYVPGVPRSIMPMTTVQGYGSLLGYITDPAVYGVPGFSVDPAQNLIYTAMNINTKNYNIGDLAGANYENFAASPYDILNGALGSGVSMTDSSSVIYEIEQATSNPVGKGMQELAYGQIPSPGSNTVLTYYNRDTWDGNQPRFFMADTASELRQTFEDIARSIVMFGKNVEATATLNTDQFELYTGFANAPRGYEVSGAAQNVTINNGQISWTMDGIPRSSVNRITIYVQVKPGSYTDGLYYPALKNISLSYIDDQNFSSNGVIVPTQVNKDFPFVYVCPSDDTIQNNGLGTSSDSIITTTTGKTGKTASTNGPAGYGTMESNDSTATKTTGNILINGIEEEVQRHESSTKRIVITADTAKLYQKTTSGKYKAVATVKKGNTFTVLSEDDTYYKVQYLKKDAEKASVGYILKKDAQIITNNKTASVAATSSTASTQ